MNPGDPFFSIIMPTYNRAHLLQPAIDSVLQQKYSAWELIVVDDGSTDDTKALLQSNRDKDDRIRYIYQENAERSAARNNGIEHATGKYICFLDSDDRYEDNCLSVLHEKIEALDEPKALIVFNAKMVTPDGTVNTVTEFKGNPNNAVEFVFTNPLATPRACVHAELLDIERFNPAVRIGEDKELWVRLVQEGELVVLDEALLIQVEHDERSITEGFFKAAIDGLKTNQLIKASNARFEKKISPQLLDCEISNSMQKVALHYMWTNKRAQALKFLFQALITAPNHPQFKLRLNAIFKLITGKDNREVAKMCRE